MNGIKLAREGQRLMKLQAYAGDKQQRSGIFRKALGELQKFGVEEGDGRHLHTVC